MEKCPSLSNSVIPIKINLGGKKKKKYGVITNQERARGVVQWVEKLLGISEFYIIVPIQALANMPRRQHMMV